MAVALAACLPESSAVVCDDGTTCGRQRVCAPAGFPGGGCVDPDQLDACVDDAGAQRADGTACALSAGTGQCRSGVCVLAGCGDGVVDLGEACDDGNRVDDDACTNACALPTCGDAVVQSGEQCDAGAANADDRACTSRCMVATCGDGFVQAGVEGCDAGADAVTGNRDDGPCTSACQRAICGDGFVFVDVEACDDGNTASGDGCQGDCKKLEVCGDGAVDAGESCDDGPAGLANPADGCDACTATAWTASALVGGDRAATAVGLNGPLGVGVDRAGNFYVADTGNHRVRRVDAATGVITTSAGTGAAGFAGDGGPATSAAFNLPASVSVDGQGTLYIIDRGNQRIRRVDGATGTVTTIVGTGTAGFGGDGGPATSALVSSPSGLALDGQGNLFVADTGNHRVRRVDAATGVITTVAGTGAAGFTGDGGLATGAWLSAPQGVAVDGDGDLFIADSSNNRIRRVDASNGVITTVAGSGVGGFAGDGGPATAARLLAPASVAVDDLGNLYVADTSNNRVRRVDAATGAITTIAGTGSFGSGGDGGPATSAQLRPQGLAISGSAFLYATESSRHRVRRIDLVSGMITTVAGTGAATSPGDGGAATSARLGSSLGVAVDSQSRVYISDTGAHRVRRVDLETGIITTVVGTGTAGSDGDGGPATSAELDGPASLAIDGDDHLYIADTYAGRIRRVDAVTGIITTVAGTGVLGTSGDGGPATSADIAGPVGLAVDSAGNLYCTDVDGYRVRRIDAATGIITTYAGAGLGFGGDGGPATSAQFLFLQGLAVDPQDNLYIADRTNHRIRRVDRVSGIITTVAGTGSSSFGGDGAAATSAHLNLPTACAFDGDGNLYIVDAGNRRIRRVDGQTGIITTVAGTGMSGFAGDGAAATAALLSPNGVAVAADGTWFVAEGARVRRVDATTGVIVTVAGGVDPEGLGPLTQASLTTPQALVLAAPMRLFAGGVAGIVQGVRGDGSALEVLAGRYPSPVATGDLARFRASSFGAVDGVAYDAATGRIYLSESTSHRILVVSTMGSGIDPAVKETWTIATLAGDGAGVVGATGSTDGAALAARFRSPTGLFFDEATRRLTVADTGNHAIRVIDLSTETGAVAGDVAAATVTTIAGSPNTLGFFGDGGPADAALLARPRAITYAPNGDLFIADTGNHRVRRVDAVTGVITTVLGDGVAASSGQGAPAWTFPVNAPLGLATDAFGNLFVTSTTTVRMITADATGVVDGSGAVQTLFGGPPRDTFPGSIATCLTGIATVDADTVQVVDSCTGLLVELWRQPAP
ncbi:MAG: DUF4215 domain-containing protein [Kofleriaceae bacterium]